MKRKSLQPSKLSYTKYVVAILNPQPVNGLDKYGITDDETTVSTVTTSGF